MNKVNKENKKVEKKELSRILIANRGEIALRAIQTIQEMGKESIAIYSIADKDATTSIRLAQKCV